MEHGHRNRIFHFFFLIKGKKSSSQQKESIFFLGLLFIYFPT